MEPDKVVICLSRAACHSMIHSTEGMRVEVQGVVTCTRDPIEEIKSKDLSLNQQLTIIREITEHSRDKE